MLVRHGGGTGQLRLWRNAGIVCEVVDYGPGFNAAPYLGRTQPPPAASSGGRGLWLAERTSDMLVIDSGPTGTTVSVHAHLGR